MDQQLAEVSEGWTTVESTMRAIFLLRETIAKLSAGMTEPFPDRDAEIAFFSGGMATVLRAAILFPPGQPV